MLCLAVFLRKYVLFIFAVSVLFGVSPVLRGQTFTDVSHLLEPRFSDFQLSASVADLNNDGLIDIYHPRRLYLNRGERGFEDILLSADIDEGVGTCGATFGDYDGDGYLDILIISGTTDTRIFRNRGGLQFERVDQDLGVQVLPFAMSAGWADFNLDGHLDLFVDNDFGENQLFKNLGSGAFRDISISAGVQQVGNSYGMGWSDYDRDGFPDIFIATCSFRPENSIKHLLRNNGDETFTNVNVEAAVNDSLASWSSLWLDYNNDGWTDIFVVNVHGINDVAEQRKNKLYHNNGDGTFTDMSLAAGVAGELVEATYNAAAADFDNDGWIDIYTGVSESQDRLFRNQGDGTFEDIAAAAGLGEESHSAVAVADFNNDGWMDILTTGLPENRLLYNNGGTNHWLKVRLRGANGNRFGIGARIEIYAGVHYQLREISAGDSYCSQSDNLTAHFGLGVTAMVDSMIVNWPGGSSDRFYDIPADRDVTIVQNQGVNQPPSSFVLREPPDGTQLGVPTSALRFRWDASRDPEREDLMYRLYFTGPALDTLFEVGNEVSIDIAPEFFSRNQVCSWSVDVTDGHSIAATNAFRFSDSACQVRPLFALLDQSFLVHDGQINGASWGDFTGDGYDDLILPNRSGNNAVLINNTDGSFAPQSGGAAAIAGSYRGAAWGDMENDGDLDLFVSGTSGENFLFRNDDGTLSVANVLDGSNSLGGSWVDYDNDGDLDLFVNNFDDNNFMYRNAGTGVLARVSAGPITTDVGAWLHAAWGDYNGNGRLDLYLTGLEGNAFYRNDGGIFGRPDDFSIVTEAGESRSASWGDYDNDGDLDLFVSQINEPTNLLFRNDGDGSFTRIFDAELANTDDVAISTSWIDIDNDGDLDLFLTALVTNKLYTNDGAGHFTEIGNTQATLYSARSCSWSDYDRDGDQDLLLVSTGGRAVLYTNTGNENHWVGFKCIGVTSNRSAIGAKVRVKASINAEEVWQLREITSLSGYNSQSSLRVHFGLGDATVIDSVRIEWPSGQVDVTTNVRANRFFDVIEGQGVTSVESPVATVPEQFRLEQNYPNPFNPETNIAYKLPVSAEVVLDLFNVRGQRVRRLVERRQSAGSYRVLWDGMDDSGREVPSGVYFYRLTAFDFVQTRRLVFLR